MLQPTPLTWRALPLIVVWTLLALFDTLPASGDSAGDSASAPHALDLHVETTTFLLNLEKQGLEDNTFTNGLGRDTTLMGNLLNVYVRKRLLSSVDLDLGVFANMPYGHDTEVSQVRPIIRLQYRPTEEITALLGTLAVPHRDFHDAVFDNANRFVRPIEQGAQVTVNSEYYRQDLFINWEQAFRGSATNRYDVGYAGQLRAGLFRFNGQAHWVHHGQALLKLDRSFNTGNNLVTAFGPELVFKPARYFSSLRWWNELGIRLTYLNSFNQAARATPYDQGRGYDVQAWLDIAGWRPRIGFWRGVNFLGQQGDPEFVAGNFMEVGLSKVYALGENASIEFGVQARRLRNAVNEFIPQGTKWVNQQYLVFNWNWDTANGRFMRDLFPTQSNPAATEPSDPTPRFTAKLDTLTYVYNIGYSGLLEIGGRPVANSTLAGQYLAPVLRYSPSSRLNLDIGVFAGLPVGDTQRFHTVQPILSAEYELWPAVSLIAGTIKRNHPFVDALFNDASLFSRPLEQGFQLLVNREHYQQDLFINWNQIETFQKAERFDVGYAGRASAGFFSLNGQVYWTHSGGAQYSESRTFFGAGLPRDRPASNNFLTAVGPQFTFQPNRYSSALSWFREIDVMALYLTSQNEPTQSGAPIVRGRGYQLTAGVDLDGWRPYVTIWRGEHFVNEQGDPAYYAGNFTEFGLLRDFLLPAGFSLRVGGFGRVIDNRMTHTEYALLNWSWDQSPWRGFCLRPTLLHRSESSCSQP
ncbi:MAG TPA: hypothetical protein PK866_12745 [Nitrospira sp.]|nr:hypothetical protein [Nitrospira sp.]